MRNLENLVIELAEIEMNEATHDDMPEDYTDLENFYLSNVTKDSYVNYFLRDVLSSDELEAYNLTEVQDLVIQKIEEKFEAIKK